MRWSRPSVVAALAVATLAAGLASPTASYALGTPRQPGLPVSPYTVLTMQAPVGGGTLGSGQAVYDDTDATVQASLAPNHSLNFTGDVPGGAGVQVIVDPPVGVSFTAGTTYDVAAINTATDASMFIGLDPTGCSGSTGTVDVEDATYDGSGNPLTFAATWVYSCPGEDPYTGEIRYNSAIPYAVGLTPASPIAFGSNDIGVTSAEQDVVVTGEGPTPLQIGGAAALAGTDPDSFVITADGCKGMTLAAGDTCTVSVAASPQTAGALNATLTVPDNSAGGLTATSLTASGVDGAKGAYHPVSPHRILDTRNGTGAAEGQLAGGSTIDLAVDGHAGVPSAGVSAVVLNVTVQGPTAKSGYITAYPDGTTRPTASNLNYTKDWTGANLVTVPVGSDGKVRLYNDAGHVSLISDVVGWYAAGDSVIAAHGVGESYQPVTPERILDTRSSAALPGGFAETIPLDFDTAGFPSANSDITAFAVTITATNATASGYLTGFDGGPATDPTTTSTVNFRSGITVPNMAIVPTSISTDSASAGDAQIGVYNSSARPVDVIVDLVGVYATDDLPDGLRFQPLATPTRIVDTRSGLGTTRLGARATHTVAVPPSVANVDTIALAANVTAAAPSAKTYLTVWPDDGSPKPIASNLNPRAGISVADAAAIGLGDGNVFDVYNNAGATDLVVDVDGTFQAYPASGKSSTAIGAQALSRLLANRRPSLRARSDLSQPLLRPTIGRPGRNDVSAYTRP